MAAVRPFRDTQRVIARLLIHFGLRTARSLSESRGGDFKKAAIFLALVQAQRAFLRPRPTSALAIASSLGVPPQTVRRHLAEFVRQKICMAHGHAGWTTAETDEAMSLVRLQRALAGEHFMRLLFEAKSLGFDFDELDESGWPGAEPDYRARFEERAVKPDDIMGTIASDFFLRFIQCGLKLHESVLERALIYVAIMAGNTDKISYDPEIAWKYTTLATVPPDALRRPVTIREISQMTLMPYETARRYVSILLREGQCIRASNGGYIIPSDVTSRSEAMEAQNLTCVRFAQAIGQLKRLGVDLASLSTDGVQSGREITSHRNYETGTESES